MIVFLSGFLLFGICAIGGPPVLLTIIGFCIKRKNPIIAKLLFILAVVYLIAGLGICASFF